MTLEDEHASFNDNFARITADFKMNQPTADMMVVGGSGGAPVAIQPPRRRTEKPKPSDKIQPINRMVKLEQTAGGSHRVTIAPQQK